MRGEAHVALTGGSSARGLHMELREPGRRAAIDWSRIHLWFGDDRFVATVDPECNAGLAQRTLLSPGGPAVRQRPRAPRSPRCGDGRRRRPGLGGRDVRPADPRRRAGQRRCARLRRGAAGHGLGCAHPVGVPGQRRAGVQVRPWCWASRHRPTSRRTCHASRSARPCCRWRVTSWCWCPVPPRRPSWRRCSETSTTPVAGRPSWPSAATPRGCWTRAAAPVCRARARSANHAAPRRRWVCWSAAADGPEGGQGACSGLGEVDDGRRVVHAQH